jgi:hypothetical protein
MKKNHIILFASIAMMGCASLTKTQIETVNQFAQASKSYSAFPSKIMTGLADIRTLRGIYAANSIDSAEIHLQELNAAYNLRTSNYEQSQKADITFQIIDQYAKSLILLSSDQYVTDLKAQALTLGPGLDSLIARYNTLDKNNKIPTGIGESVSQLVVFGGKQFIRHKQAKEIKKFVTKADDLIAVMAKNLLEFLEGKHFVQALGDSASLKYLIDYEAKAIKRDYLSYLRQNKATIDNDKEYLKLMSDVDQVKSLQGQTLAATKDLRAAHKQLLEILKKRKKLKERFTELQELYEDVNQLKTTIGKIQTVKP